MLNVITGDVRRNIALGFKIGLNMPDMAMNNLAVAECDPAYEVRGGFALKVSPITFDYVLQWTGEEFIHPILFINDRSLLAGNMGATLPANLVTGIPARIHMVNQLRKLAAEIQEYDRDFRGWVTIRMCCIDDTLYYNNISFELLPDYYHALIRLYGYTNENYFLLDYRDKKLPEPQGMTVSARLYAYPYSVAENIAIIMPYLEVLDAIDINDCFMVLHHSKKVHIKNTWKELYKRICNKVYMHNGMCYNPDGGEKARIVYNVLQKARLLKGYK